MIMLIMEQRYNKYSLFFVAFGGAHVCVSLFVFVLGLNSTKYACICKLDTINTRLCYIIKVSHFLDIGARCSVCAV